MFKTYFNVPIDDWQILIMTPFHYIIIYKLCQSNIICKSVGTLLDNYYFFLQISWKKIENDLDRVETGRKFKEKMDINKRLCVYVHILNIPKVLRILLGELLSKWKKMEALVNNKENIHETLSTYLCLWKYHWAQMTFYWAISYVTSQSQQNE